MNKKDQLRLKAFVCQKSESFFYAYPEFELSKDQQQRYDSLLEKLLTGVPLAYIINHAQFFSLDFFVDESVLIPRSDTECLVEWALDNVDPEAEIRLADLGTGSGAIACAIAHERPRWHIVATDVSEAAIATAKKNATALGLSNIEFSQGSWCDALQGEFDVIVSNPPYIATDDQHIQKEVKQYEPHKALFAKDQGICDLQCIVDQAKTYLKKNGVLILEHGFSQQALLKAYLKEQGYKQIKGHQDYGQLERFVSASI